jgi:catechol 2,3-dioxygenase-like lactoylglutathione lyase family enzyme
MEQRISLITLGVTDLERSRRFYEQGLGWRPGYVSEEVVFFQAGGMVFALFPRDALAADLRQSSSGSGFSGIALAHNVRTREEVDAVLAEAAAAGATILKPAVEAPWGGYSGYFADPDGHPWEIAWNPHWPIAEDGSVRLGE